MLITQFTRKFLEIPFCIQTLGDLNMKKKQYVANSHWSGWIFKPYVCYETTSGALWDIHSSCKRVLSDSCGVFPKE